MRNSGEAYIDKCTMDIFICLGSEFWVTFGREKIFWFGGHNGELESPKVWAVIEISEFGGRKYAKSIT